MSDKTLNVVLIDECDPTVKVLYNNIILLELDLCRDIVTFTNNTSDGISDMITVFKAYVEHMVMEPTQYDRIRILKDWDVTYTADEYGQYRELTHGDSEAFPYKLIVFDCPVNRELIDHTIQKTILMVSNVIALHSMGFKYTK
jgi:hypothetical protein